MNRRDFLRTALLVLPALVTKFQLEPEKFEIISPSETFLKAYEKFPEAFQEGYKIGQNVVEGYAEGVQSPVTQVGPGMETYSYTWSSNNCDPIADLKAVHDWIYENRGLERQPLLMSKHFEHLFSERDKLSIRFI